MAEYRRMNHLLRERAVALLRVHFIPDRLRLVYKRRGKLSLQVCVRKISINSINVNYTNICICLQPLWALFIMEILIPETQDQRNTKNQNTNHHCNGSPLPVSPGLLLIPGAGGGCAAKPWHFQRETSAARKTRRCRWFMSRTEPPCALA